MSRISTLTKKKDDEEEEEQFLTYLYKSIGKTYVKKPHEDPEAYIEDIYVATDSWMKDGQRIYEERKKYLKHLKDAGKADTKDLQATVERIEREIIQFEKYSKLALGMKETEQIPPGLMAESVTHKSDILITKREVNLSTMRIPTLIKTQMIKEQEGKNSKERLQNLKTLLRIQQEQILKQAKTDGKNLKVSSDYRITGSEETLEEVITKTTLFANYIRERASKDKPGPRVGENALKMWDNFVSNSDKTRIEFSSRLAHIEDETEREQFIKEYNINRSRTLKTLQERTKQVDEAVAVAVPPPEASASAKQQHAVTKEEDEAYKIQKGLKQPSLSPVVQTAIKHERPSVLPPPQVNNLVQPDPLEERRRLIAEAQRLHEEEKAQKLHEEKEAQRLLDEANKAKQKQATSQPPPIPSNLSDYEFHTPLSTRNNSFSNLADLLSNDNIILMEQDDATFSRYLRTNPHHKLGYSTQYTGKLTDVNSNKMLAQMSPHVTHKAMMKASVSGKFGSIKYDSKLFF